MGRSHEPDLGVTLSVVKRKSFKLGVIEFGFSIAKEHPGCFCGEVNVCPQCLELCLLGSRG